MNEKKILLSIFKIKMKHDVLFICDSLYKSDVIVSILFPQATSEQHKKKLKINKFKMHNNSNVLKYILKTIIDLYIQTLICNLRSFTKNPMIKYWLQLYACCYFELS